MRVVILTSGLYGTASHHLKYLLANSKAEIAMVVFNEGHVRNKQAKIIKKIKKIFQIGPLGALNGIRMRKWFNEDTNKYLETENIKEICIKHNIPFRTTNTINCITTQDLFVEARADLGISLGNGYIGSKIFSIPTHGMINIHHEILPDYQNAQSILWQLYNNSDHTGYTIHKIDKQIDTGEILLQETTDIVLRDTLADTVTFTFVQLLNLSAIGLCKVIDDFETYLKHAKIQGHGTSYTTPTIWQFLKIQAVFKDLKKQKNQ
ncbi:MAG: formyltransferase family protein [Bacteroidota bacterium]